MIVMKRIERSLSEGRKIFRLFKWFDEIAAMIKRARKGVQDAWFREILFYLGSMSSFGYYLLDNIVWFSSIKVISKYIAYNIKWKKAKDLFSLLRCMIEITKCISMMVDLI